jgi:preprotein translocase subunit SecY
VGNKVYGGQSSHLPLKINMAGVIPPIFASSIILLPATLATWVSNGESGRWLKDVAAALSPGQPIYIALYAAGIVFFCFFYTGLVFSSRETAENLKKSGAFVPGIRPGDQTSRYIEKILLRLTFIGAIYITLVSLLPEFLILKYNVPFNFGGTSLLIIVVVTMDFGTSQTELTERTTWATCNRTTVALASWVGVTWEFLQNDACSGTLFVCCFCIVCNCFVFCVNFSVFCDEFVTLEFTLD